MEASLTARRDLPVRRLVAGVVVVALIAASLFASRSAYRLLKYDSNEFNLAQWELRHVPEKWLYSLGSLFRDDLSVTEQNQRLQSFFDLTREIDSMERRASDATQRGQPPDSALLASISDRRAERQRIESQVEAIIEGRLSQVLADEGITRTFLGLVWPPVDFELTRAPSTLVASRRDRIELVNSDLLREDLSLAEIEKIEADTARRDNLSTLAFPTSGIAAYPTIVDYPSSYRAAVDVVAHEWTHNYLAFRPLGIRYYDSYQLRALNETVADITGHELASRIIARWPLGEPQPPQPVTPRAPRPEGQPERLDLGAELRKIRGEVEVLLAEGKIEEAEVLMETRRQELVARGANIRKLNQAYFAFTNLYAGERGSPGATNPIGPKIDEVRRRTASLHDFLWLMSGVTSVAELDAALAELQAVPGSPTQPQD